MRKLHRLAGKGRVFHQKKQTQPGGWVKGNREVSQLCGDLVDIGGLRALLTVNDFELDVVALRQAFVTFTRDTGIMNEHIGPIIAADESVPLGVIEPFNLAFDSRHVLFLSY